MTVNIYTFHFLAGETPIRTTAKGSMEDLTLTYDAEDTTLTANAFTRNGYHFANWLGSDGNVYENEQDMRDLLAAGSGELTLTAQWAPNTDNHYTISYWFENADGEYEWKEKEDQVVTATTGDPVELVLAEMRRYDGYTLNPNYRDSIIAANAVSPSGGTTLSLYYKRNIYHITLWDDSAKVSQNTWKNVYGEELKLYDYSKTGYTFDGWFTSADFSGAEVKAGAPTPAFAVEYDINRASEGYDVKLYAKMAGLPYALSFDANYPGGANPDGKTVTCGEAYGELPSLARREALFGGWYTAATGGTKITAASRVDIVGNHTLYAHWETASIKRVQEIVNLNDAFALIHRETGMEDVVGLSGALAGHEAALTAHEAAIAAERNQLNGLTKVYFAETEPEGIRDNDTWLAIYT